MKYSILILFSILGIFGSCKNSKQSIASETYSGELFFKLINFHKAPLRTYCEKLNINSIDKNEKDIIEYCQFLKEAKLIDLYSFELTIKTNPINEYILSSNSPNNEMNFSKIYVDSIQYQKIKFYELSELRKNNEKVLINFTGIKIRDGIFRCDKIESIRIKPGITHSTK